MGWVIFTIVVGVLLGILIPNWGKGKIDEGNHTQDNYMKKRGVTKSIEYEWSDISNSRHYRFVVDDVNNMVYIFSGTNKQERTCIPYREIVGFEVLANNQVVGGIGNVVKGALIAGSIGAMVGATRGVNAVSSYKGVLYRDNISEPKYEFNFIVAKTKTTDFMYKISSEFAENVNAAVKAIISKNSRLNQMQQDNNDISNKLSQLKKAFDNDLISRAEYETKRKELLNRL